jgi:hypothetical protein
MSDFMESARNFVNAAVSRTGWEAQKQMRLRSKQSEIEKLLEQRRQLIDELGRVAMTLYTQGTLTDAQLTRLCASIYELDHDLQGREKQLQDIKGEVYPADQMGPAPTVNYAPPPPPPSPSTPPPGPGTRPQPQAGQLEHCPQCGSPVRSKSLYCRSCGAKLH